VGGPAARRVRPARRSITARAVRAGGCAVVCALVLDIARMEHFPGATLFWRNGGAGNWAWAREAAAVWLIAACLAADFHIDGCRADHADDACKDGHHHAP